MPQSESNTFDPLRIPYLPGEDRQAYHARIQRDYPDAWIVMLRDWHSQARMNRNHGHISEAEFQAAVADIRSRFLAAGVDPPED
ncbi:hypothetical protein MBRA_50340 (plasmid) [Mycobacterium branderi]|uniref:Uncharacterized protein n=1 Tax=Mycobacterium branderi TaxID=43348 RepID=A0ABM7KUS6_9MYCO|nr:hypothetical protein MBRA_50340 [Mycobacterium branderi]